jgi:deoxycytidylate deaminase
MSERGPTPRPEIVIGLVGAIGTDLYLVAELTTTILQGFGYEVEDVISLSRLLDDIRRQQALPATPRESYIDSRMTAGNDLRRQLQHGDALAQLAVADIMRRRRRRQDSVHLPHDQAPEAVAYILRSLKHQDEIALLRDLYRERFVCISAHAPRDDRIKRLAGEIADSHGSTDRHDWDAEATRLAQRDEAEEDDDFGQDVRGTFPKADFFIDASHRTVANEQLERCLRAWFGEPFASPTPEEFGMFHAHAAGVRSADLSRQVGAAIAIGGDVIAVGSNEVPAYGGGAYWTGQEGDARDFVLGLDANARVRTTTIEEVRNALVAAGWLRAGRAKQPPEEFAAALEGTRVDELTEFGRAVHAEMSAILDAARRGQPVKDATLYCTTFPCHNCAKHIVGAGLKKVVYIAPYPKSMAEDLHPDSIAIDPSDDRDDRVVFRPFVGVAPLTYLPLFEQVGKRKTDDGRAIEFVPGEARPKLVFSGDLSYLEREDLTVVSLRQTLKDRAVSLGRGRALPTLNLR